MAELYQGSAACNRHLLDLPNEILQEIAGHLPTDWDVLHLSQTSKEAMGKIFAGESRVWRYRFGANYEIPPGKTFAQLKNEYVTRAIVLGRTLDFRQREEWAPKEELRQDFWMEIVQTMLQEILTLPTKSLDSSYTLDYLKATLKDRATFLQFPNERKHRTELFYALQLCLSAVALDPNMKQHCRRSDYDMETIYSIDKGLLANHEADDEFDNTNESDTSSGSTTPVSTASSDESDSEDQEQSSEPSSEASQLPVIISKTPRSFVDHENLDLDKLLQFRAFWQRHLLSSVENTYYDSYMGLEDWVRPGVRKYDASEGSKLSTFWLGYYSCIHPFPTTLEELENRQTCAAHGEGPELMTLDLEESSDLFWPAACNKIVPLYEGLKTKRVPFAGKQDTYATQEENHVFGFLEHMEVAYGGISGWQRICFTICERLGDEFAEAKDGTDGWVHIYEALLIPGGRLMVGRWVDLKEPSAKGPFIFWCT
ncbi:unnamed protein product [Penicillium salamii]|uniref:F-box domain-containing protein n=1 Tax=Penicillium salamii TaxID=1612424 RepID=A0A9W4NFF1_9EURO|nr:unnamed protein product [Penicillium salamii]CAG8172991.1 unnamed protein product [Penicillium salamii]CAG8228907.1 unnamed protein product [Penicillium salamii]CAG8322074.1 unnamed protein product [Penicillium salamii]CAG8372339.1 unnamed protein product [Penicillium salamii]